MHVFTSRLLGGALAAVAACALTVGLAAPASAATPPAWEDGRIPTGCPITTLASGIGWESTYTDNQDPVVRSLTINGSSGVAVLPPGSTAMTWSFRVTQTCSGVANSGVLAFKYTNLNSGAGRFTLPLTATTTNAFDQVMEYSFLASTNYAGWYQTPYVQVGRRYSTFTLDGDFGLMSSLAAAAPTTYQTGAWSSQINYLLLKTTVSTSASKSTVAAGNSVTFRATLKKAGATTYDPAVGSAVRFQTKTGTGAWVTRATKTASATGAVSYTFAPSRTMSWRWVHVGEKTSTFTAPVTSTAKRITVT